MVGATLAASGGGTRAEEDPGSPGGGSLGCRAFRAGLPGDGVDSGVEGGRGLGGARERGHVRVLHTAADHSAIDLLGESVDVILGFGGEGVPGDLDGGVVRLHGEVTYPLEAGMTDAQLGDFVLTGCRLIVALMREAEDLFPDPLRGRLEP